MDDRQKNNQSENLESEQPTVRDDGQPNAYRTLDGTDKAQQEEQLPVAENTGKPQKKSSKKTVLVLAAIAALLLLGTAAFAVYTLSNDPQRLLVQAASNLSKQKTLAADFVAVSQTGKETSTTRGDISYRLDTSKNFELSGSIKEGDIRLSAAVRFVENAYYIRVTGLDRLDSLAADSMQRSELQSPLVQSYLTALNDTWFTFSSESVQQLLSQSGSASPTADLTDADRQKIEKAYNQYQFVNIEDKGDATVGGSATRHLLLSVDYEKYILFMESLKDSGIAWFEVTDEAIQGMRDSKEDIKNIRVETWIANEGSSFKQMKFYENNSPDTSLTLTFRPVGATEDATIKAPQDAQDLTQLLQLFSENSNSDAARPADGGNRPVLQ